MKQPSERGVTGAWAYQARQESGLSVEQVADELARRGQAVSPATIRGIESGSKKPGARLLRLLALVLESVPPGQPEAHPDTMTGDLFERLTALLEAHQQRIDLLERRATAAEAMVAMLAARLMDDAPELARELLAEDQAWAGSHDDGSQHPQPDLPAGTASRPRRRPGR